MDSTTGARSKAMYWLKDRIYWERVEDDLEHERVSHCQVQINDCEVAFIGGQRGTDVVASDKIDIWNFEERTWRSGPS